MNSSQSCFVLPHLSSVLRFVSADASKADVAHAAVDHLRVAGCRPITSAVGWSTEKRSALDHLSWNADRGLGGIKGGFHFWTTWIPRTAAGFSGISFVARCIPVGRPLPDIARHVVQAITVRRV